MERLKSADVMSVATCRSRCILPLLAGADRLQRAHALDEAVTLVLVRPPANVVVQRAADALKQRGVDLGVHGEALGAGAGWAGGDLQPGREGLKLRHELVDELQHNAAGRCLGDHREAPCCRGAACACWQWPAGITARRRA